MLLRLFTVFWWLTVLGSLAATYLVITEPANWLLIEARWSTVANSHNEESSTADLRRCETTNDVNCLVELPGLSVALADFEAQVRQQWRWIYYSLLSCLLPYVVLTITRWTIVGRWRFGPRW